ncbi:hypothetical protein COLO4_13435 [Corchorus olitorius]|uniref:FHA domain-containing protein n=1 Tax=Corchorus olitorius TaxID=93759 RepID=A0A1R3JWH5_9ROSI|nr:hypothetical protein COLO4_13435 [Corchorus olitorius]
MVWALLPVDPSSGEEDKYYIFRKGTYKVGRKGCDIIIYKDKGVSRIHADIIVDDMTQSSQVRIKDLSKYGTVINKNLCSKKKVHEFPDKHTSLEDGDLLSFGTGNATYRFCSIPLILYICSADISPMNHHLQDKVSSIGLAPRDGKHWEKNPRLVGARLTHVFGEECTHVLIDQHMLLKGELLDAIVAKKPVLHISWLEFVAEKCIRTELPSGSPHVPRITVDGVSIEVSDPETRENCLDGYTFLLESTHMYKFGDRLQSLLEVSGSRSFWVKDICSSSQASECGEHSRLVYVTPGRSVEKLDHLEKLGLSYRVNEITLISAVLSGKLDQSLLICSSVVVSSSCSTDETVVADSDDEHESATPANANGSTHKEGAQTYANKAEMSLEAPNHVNKAEGSTYNDATRFQDSQVTLRDDNGCLTARRNKAEESENGNSDIIYSEALIIRDVHIPSTINMIADNRVINYKRFRKASIQSGNSFNNLVPFSKYPYKDHDLGSEDLAECVKEEKKRKKMEALAEDLFNNEKGRQRGLSASLRGRWQRIWIYNISLSITKLHCAYCESMKSRDHVLYMVLTPKSFGKEPCLPAIFILHKTIGCWQDEYHWAICRIKGKSFLSSVLNLAWKVEMLNAMGGKLKDEGIASEANFPNGVNEDQEPGNIMLMERKFRAGVANEPGKKEEFGGEAFKLSNPMPIIRWRELLGKQDMLKELSAPELQRGQMRLVLSNPMTIIRWRELLGKQDMLKEQGRSSNKDYVDRLFEN